MSDSRLKEFVDTGEFRKASEWVSSRNDLTQFERILKAHIEVEAGDSLLARQQVETLLTEHLSHTARAQCFDVLGRALGNLGSPSLGLTYLQKALAATKPNTHAYAEILGRYVKALLSWIGVEPALAELPRLRRAALETGSRRALVDYHILYARLAAIRGWWARAEAEVQVAADLLERDCLIDQLWRLRQVQAAMAIKNCGLVFGRTFAEEALKLAYAVSSKPAIALTLANLAKIAALSGKHSDARAYIDQSLSLFGEHNVGRFALYFSEIEIGLASGDDEYARDAVRRGKSLSADLATEPGYYELWFKLNHVRFLIRHNHHAEASTLALGSLKAIERLADNNLQFRMRLLAAEALAKCGQPQAGRELITVSSSRCGDLNLETVAEINRVAAVLSANVDGEKTKYLRRAWQVLNSSGLFGLQAEVERTGSELAIPLERMQADVVSADALATVEAVALIMQLGQNPKAFGAQLLDLLQTLDICKYAVLCGIDANGSFEIASIGSACNGESKFSVLFDLGSHQDCNYSLRAIPRRSETTTMPWIAIDQIVQAARASARPKSFEEDSITLWPSETLAHELGMVVAGESMRELVATARRLAPSNITVLITGETGTGKELLARGLHDASPRHAKPFLPFNCTAVARDMLDAQLFGYRRGAFTGAQDAFPGVIRTAAGGTLFLDEIGELTLDVQPKLLRFLESGEIHPLGEPKPIPVDVRIVAATNANLEQLVADGKFREDLFYRLNVVRLQVPPLRERREEIPPLVQHYLEKAGRESQRTGLRLAEETMEYLILYKWPGNVRQLANEIRRMVALAESGAVLMPEHLSSSIRASRRTIPPSDRTPDPTEFVVRMDQPMSAAVEHLERSMVIYALKLANGRQDEAAQLLGLSRKGLYLKRHRLGISESAVSDKSPATESEARPETATGSAGPH